MCQDLIFMLAVTELLEAATWCSSIPADAVCAALSARAAASAGQGSGKQQESKFWTEGDVLKASRRSKLRTGL